MTFLHVNDVSLAFTTPFMKLAGCWPAKSTFEEFCRGTMRAITTLLVVFSCATHVTDAFAVKVCTKGGYQKNNFVEYLSQKPLEMERMLYSYA